MVYGIAAFVYRMFIIFAIVLFVASKYLFVGVVIAIWAVATQLLVPLGKGVAFVVASPRVHRKRIRTRLVTLTLVGVLAALVFAVPVPLRSNGTFSASIFASTRSPVGTPCDWTVTVYFSLPTLTPHSPVC